MMPLTFKAALADIKSSISTKKVGIARVVYHEATTLLSTRPDDEKTIETFDSEMIEFTQAVWDLSTCSDKELMAGFCESPDTAYPLFADDEYVIEYNDEGLDGPSLAWYPWEEIRAELMGDLVTSLYQVSEGDVSEYDIGDHPPVDTYGTDWIVVRASSEQDALRLSVLHDRGRLPDRANASPSELGF